MDASIDLYNNSDVLKILIAAGTDINTTALIAATWSKNEDVIKSLITAGVNLDTVCNRKAFADAVSFGYFEIAKLLAEAGADVNEIGFYEMSPLMTAVCYGSGQFVDLIINGSKGVPDLDMRNSKGETPLIIAVKQQYHDIIKLLVEAGADLCAYDNQGKTAFEYFLLYCESKWTHTQYCTKTDMT